MPSFPGLQDYFEDDDVLYWDLPWTILKTDKLAGYMAQVAVVGHKCDQFDVVQFMDEEDCLRGECWWCKTTIPDRIQFMWQMLNWEKLPDMRTYQSDEKWGKCQPIKPYKPKKMCSRVGSWAPFNKKQTIIGRYTAP